MIIDFQQLTFSYLLVSFFSFALPSYGLHFVGSKIVRTLE